MYINIILFWWLIYIVQKMAYLNTHAFSQKSMKKNSVRFSFWIRRFIRFLSGLIRQHRIHLCFYLLNLCVFCIFFYLVNLHARAELNVLRWLVDRYFRVSRNTYLWKHKIKQFLDNISYVEYCNIHGIKLYSTKIFT